jgi:DNA-binding response OmpR family regulator
MAYRILLVNPDDAALASAHDALAGAGYRVVGLNSFQEGVRQIADCCPDLLVTALRLRAFNGLHLLLRARTRDPELPAIVVGELADLTRDITRVHAHFISTPVDAATFSSLVAEVLRGRRPKDPHEGRVWPRKRAAMAATLRHAPVTASELSYSGMRLELLAPPRESLEQFDVRLPDFGISVSVVARWSRPAHDQYGWWWCGAEVQLANEAAISAWRSIVDSVT